MEIKICEIPGLPDEIGTPWKIRALMIDGKSFALNALLEWQSKQPNDYKKILNSLKLAASSKLPLHSPKHVKKSIAHENVYEARADKMHARLFFFYSREKEQIIVCTNDYWKKGDGKGQDAAFNFCNKLKFMYENRK